MSKRVKRDWTPISLRKEQYNGLQLIAARERRPVSQVLDFVLQKIKIPEYTDEELEAKLAVIAKAHPIKVEIEVAR